MMEVKECYKELLTGKADVVMLKHMPTVEEMVNMYYEQHIIFHMKHGVIYARREV